MHVHMFMHLYNLVSNVELFTAVSHRAKRNERDKYSCVTFTTNDIKPQACALRSSENNSVILCITYSSLRGQVCVAKKSRRKYLISERYFSIPFQDSTNCITQWSLVDEYFLESYKHTSQVGTAKC